MLIYDSSKYLGDSLLSPDEANYKIREGNQKLIDEKKIPHQSLLENADMALGYPMQSSEFIRRLTLLKPGLVIKPGIPGAVAVYFPTYDVDERKTVLKYVSGFYIDKMMQEYSHITTDDKGLAKREVRGWRTVLLALIHQGIVTYAQVKAAFGEPTGQRNILWNEQMRERKQ